MKSIFYCFIALFTYSSAISQEQAKKSESKNKLFTEEVQKNEKGQKTIKIKFADGKGASLIEDENGGFFIDKNGPYKKDAAIDMLYKKTHPTDLSNQPSNVNQNNGGDQSYGGVGGTDKLIASEKYDGKDRKVFKSADGSKYYKDDKGNKVFVEKNGKMLIKSDNLKKVEKEKEKKAKTSVKSKSTTTTTKSAPKKSSFSFGRKGKRR